MPKKDERPVNDPLTDGSILKMDEWRSFALYPNEEHMDLLAVRLEKETGVQPPYLTTFEDLTKIPAIHTKSFKFKESRFATTFVINAYLILPRIYYIIFETLKGGEEKISSTTMTT